MCIAILKTAGSIITDDQLKNCHTSNKDGCGFAYVNTDYTGVNKIKVYKTMDFDKFMVKYKRALENNPDSPFLIHFRIATHGTVDTFNCHPFKVKKDMYMIHNGVISGVGVDKIKSDTQLFNDKVLKGLPKGWEKNEAIKTLLEKFLLGSKMLFLKEDKSFFILNESAGHWNKGIWFSNNSYEKRKNIIYMSPGYYKGPEKNTKMNTFQCDSCSTFFNEFDMRFYVDRGRPLAFCKDCARLEKLYKTVSPKDEVGKWKYQIEMNKILFTDELEDDCSYDNGQRFLG